MIWYSFPRGWGLRGTLMNPGQNLSGKIFHRLIEATDPGGSVVLQIVLIEVVYHLRYIMKTIQKWSRRLVCKPHGRYIWYELSEGHVLLQTEGGSLPNWCRIWGPPQSSVIDSVKERHEDVASLKHIQLLQGNVVPWNFLVGCWDQNTPHPLLRECHPEER